MDFELDGEQRMLADTIRTLLARSYDVTKRNEIAATDRAWSPQVWKQLADLGVLGLSFAEADGGAGAGPVETMVVMNELGRALAPEPYLDSVLVPGALLTAGGSADQRAHYLPRLSAGVAMMAFAHTEPGRRWPMPSLATVAVNDADGWSISGTKNPVRHGDCADTLIVSAALPSGETGLFLIDIDAAGVSRTPYATHDQRRGAEIRFDRAPAQPLGAGGNAAVPDAAAAIAEADIRAQAALCAEAVGAMDEVLKLTVAYLKQRKQFGVALKTFQALTHRAADMYVHCELANSMSRYATMSLAEGVVDPTVASRAKLAVGRAARAVGQEALQLHGGIGLTAEYPVGHYVSRLTAIEHTLGNSETHLRSLAAGVAKYDMVLVTG
jgi:alkylation response protein AidB-like acyl-CoA dehydrogenase